MMIVGVLEVTLFLEGNSSLKAKRKVVKSILGRVRSRFNVGASEVGDQDRHEYAVLGFAVCGGEATILNSVLDHLMNFIDENVDAEVLDSRMECVPWSDSVGLDE